jgi:ATP-dependent helicase HrpB
MKMQCNGKIECLCLRKWDLSTQWPNVNTETLLLTNSEWLSPYLNQIKKPEDLKKIDLSEILHFSLPHALQVKLEELAPQKVTIPNGTKVALQYQADGSAPILAVRLQDCFGLQETPKVNHGKVNVLMHLLSPGYKLVQTTSDLNSFWKDAYFEVRKELRIKYKKHHWPENPLTAEVRKPPTKKP